MTFDELISRTGINLNEQQCAAVMQTEGSVLLLAVPGSGKTVSLVMRIAYMVKCLGIDPSNILTLTYTVAAADDMKKRYASFFGSEESAHIEFRTINGICHRIIGKAAERYGKEPFRLLSDDKEAAALLSRIYFDVEGSYATEADLKSVRTYISYIKNMMLTPEEEAEFNDKNEYDISAIRSAYDKALRAEGCMDYDDQMRYALNMLRADSGLLRHYRELYRYVCVDEAQDTSRIQHAVIELIAGSSGNLFMVGDEDQSIYGFRAAWPKALLNFEHRHKDAKVLLMETNYRSDANIVRAADAFIAKNKDRHPKHMNAANAAENGAVGYIRIPGTSAQYEMLADIARSSYDGTRAVLYRDNESAVPLIDLFEREGIAYSVKGADLTFFQSRIVNDIRAVARLAYNGCDQEAFMSVYYKISTYLTKADAEKACRISGKTGDSIIDTALSLTGLGPSTLQSCRNVRNMLQRLTEVSAAEAIDIIRIELGYDRYLERMKMKKNKLRAVRAVAENEASLEALIVRLDVLDEISRRGSNHDNPDIILSTMHASKGLEYDTVYIMDAYEGILPEQPLKNIMSWDKEALEAYNEERRLFYVGVTRARKKLRLLMYPGRHGFCDEILGTAVSGTGSAGSGGIGKSASGTSQNKSSGRQWQDPYKADEAGSRLYHETGCKSLDSVNQGLYGAGEGGKSSYFTGDPDFKKFSDSLQYGTDIEHSRYGRGIVVSNDGQKITAAFKDGAKEFSLAAVYGRDIIKIV